MGRDSTTSKTDTTKRQRTHGNRLIKIGIPVTVLLVAAVLAGGRIHNSLQICVGIAAIGAALTHPSVAKPARVLWWMGVAALAWLVITILPLPLANLGAERIAYFEQMRDVLQERPTLPGEEPPQKDAETVATTSLPGETQGTESRPSGRISLNRAGTLRFILILTGSWCLFWMTAAMSSTQRRTFLKIVLLAGTVIALLGLAGRTILPTENHVWWLFEVPYKVGGGPFVNRNHFASFCAMLIPLSLCLLLAPELEIGPRPRKKRRKKLPSTRANDADSSGQEDKRHKADERGQKQPLDGHDNDHPAHSQVPKGSGRLLFGACLGILVCTVILTFSRGGMLAMIVGALVAASFWLRGHPILATGATVALMGIVFTFLFWPSDALQQRIRTLSDLESASPLRHEMRKAAMEQWRDFPVLGAGAEGFRVLYGVYRLHPGEQAPRYCENEYVQLLADLGLVGLGGSLALGIAYLVTVLSGAQTKGSTRRSTPLISAMHLWARGKRRSDVHAMSRALFAVAIGTGGALLFHFSCDFPCRVPLNAFLAASLLGVGMPLPERSRKTRRAYWQPRTGIFAILALTLLVFAWGRAIEYDRPELLRDASASLTQKAIQATPPFWHPWYQMARDYTEVAYELDIQGGETSSGKSNSLRTFGISCLKRATELNPLHYQLPCEVARIRFQMGGIVDQEVRDAFRKAASLAPKRRDIWHEWLDAEIEGQDIEAVTDVAKFAQDRASKRIAISLWERLYKIHEENNNLRQSYEAVRRINKIQPNNYRMLRRQSKLELRMGLTRAACLSLAKACEAKPESHDAWFELGRIELDRGNDLQANQAFTKAIRLKPSLRKRVNELWEKHKSGPRPSNGAQSDSPTPGLEF